MPTPRRRRPQVPVFAVRHSGGILVAVVFWLMTLPVANSRSAEVDSAKVQQSIDRGIAYLRSTQGERGGWKEYTGQNGGLSSLCTLALLNAGVGINDPAIQKSLAYLRKLEPTETYSVSLQTLVLCQVGAASDLVRIRRNVAWLEAEQIVGEGVEPFRHGGWGYGGGRGSGDPSNAQFALLAIDAAEQRGVRVKREVYEAAAAYWKFRQSNAGAWVYSANQPPTGSMTCAGIASTVICRAHLGKGSSRVEGGTIVCCGGESEDRDAVEAGLKWLGDRFTVQINPGNAGASTLFYYLYALERVGRMTGRRFIGGHDWYREGARRLVELQDSFQGFWAGIGFGEDDRNVTTSFALLFLAKGKRQVVIGRLRHGSDQERDDGQWNQHPEATRQLVYRLESNWGRDLTWQTVTTDNAKVEDLLQTPLLVISGNERLQFTADQRKLLKAFVDQGGAILFDANAGPGCGPATGFEASVRELCGEWFESAPLTPLPADHPVYFAEADAKPSLIGPDYQLQGVEACCRTAVFYSPLSLTCRWQLSDSSSRNRDSELPKLARDSIETAARLGQNLLAYVTGRELKDKLDTPLVIDTVDQNQLTRGSIRIARLQLDAGAREARRAIPNLVSIVSKRIPIQLKFEPEEIPIEAKRLADQTILWMHGRTDFQLNADQRRELREYLESGGFLIVDSICGSNEFAAAVRRELALVVPQSPLRPMGEDHPALSARYGGYDLHDVTVRTPSRGTAGLTVNRRRGVPNIEFATIANYDSIFFSPLDLSCALESQNSIQCPGYDTNDAARIATNFILYSLQQ